MKRRIKNVILIIVVFIVVAVFAIIIVVAKLFAPPDGVAYKLDEIDIYLYLERIPGDDKLYVYFDTQSDFRYISNYGIDKYLESSFVVCENEYDKATLSFVVSPRCDTITVVSDFAYLVKSSNLYINLPQFATNEDLEAFNEKLRSENDVYYTIRNYELVKFQNGKCYKVRAIKEIR